MCANYHPQPPNNPQWPPPGPPQPVYHQGAGPNGGPPFVAQPSGVGPPDPYGHFQAQGQAPPYGPGYQAQPPYPGQGYPPPPPGQGYPPPPPGQGYPQGQPYPGQGYPNQGYPPGQGYPNQQGNYQQQRRDSGTGMCGKCLMCCGLCACLSFCNPCELLGCLTGDCGDD